MPLPEEAIEDVVDFMRVRVVCIGREGGVCREIEGDFSKESGQEREDVGEWERRSVLIINAIKMSATHALGSV